MDMGIEEQDAIVGRLMREQREIARELSIVDAELRCFRDQLDNLHRAINVRIEGSVEGREFGSVKFNQLIPPVISKYSDLSKLETLLSERERLGARLKQNQESLKSIE